MSIESDLYTLSVQRDHQSKQIIWDGERLSGFAPIAQAIPLQLVSTLSYRFFTDGPKVRRQFFDWAMFHVEPNFYPSWKQWQRLLKQRNAALKQRLPKPEVMAWDQSLCELADAIDIQRMKLVLALQPILDEHTALLGAEFKLDLNYDRGWSPDQSLLSELGESTERDYQLGYTYAGPQRADVQLQVGGRAAATVLSQGQLKLSMYAMHLAQGYYFHQQTGRSPIYLIDDMASELDPQTQGAVLSHLIDGLNAQLFLTGITPSVFDHPSIDSATRYRIHRGSIDNQASDNVTATQ